MRRKTVSKIKVVEQECTLTKLSPFNLALYPPIVSIPIITTSPNRQHSIMHHANFPSLPKLRFKNQICDETFKKSSNRLLTTNKSWCSRPLSVKRSDQRARSSCNLYVTSSPISIVNWLAAHSRHHQPLEIYVDDEKKLTLHGLQQHFVRLEESAKNRKLNDLLDSLEFNQVRGRSVQYACMST